MISSRIFVVLLVSLMPLSGCLDNNGDSVAECDSSSEICGKVNILDAIVENTSTDDEVTSALISAKADSNSYSFTIDKVSYWSTCDRDGELVTVDPVQLTDTTELDSDDQFTFIAELSNCSASQGESLDFWVIVEDGASTIIKLEVESTQSGSSLT